ncbi:uncharacterized protein LOC133899735 [Phragmites australis]|uniref:uncharacterized protein LOC133899735 n=1 Tax=Phragmites australis TaxID=29695 RepID=UPI002D798AE0|nr:uncharacterized protein LOC133899735 [Phragmites australis]
MGTQPSAPSSLAPDVSMQGWLARNPAALGRAVAARWGSDLPFLFKALSTQAHPDRELARRSTRCASPRTATPTTSPRWPSPSPSSTRSAASPASRLFSKQNAHDQKRDSGSCNCSEVYPKMALTILYSHKVCSIPEPLPGLSCSTAT